jgi:hypothetical protein
MKTPLLGFLIHWSGVRIPPGVQKISGSYNYLGRSRKAVRVPELRFFLVEVLLSAQAHRCIAELSGSWRPSAGFDRNYANRSNAAPWCATWDYK